MNISNVEKQLIVTPAIADLQQTVINCLLACKMIKADLSNTLITVKKDHKYSIKIGEARSPETTRHLDRDYYIDINIDTLPSSDLLIILSSRSLYPHELQVLEYKGFTIEQSLVNPIAYKILGVKTKDEFYTVDRAKREIDYYKHFGKW